MREKAVKGGFRLEVRSAGISAMNGASPSDAALQVMKEKGIDHSSHRSRALCEEWVDWADLILTMTPAHKQMLIRYYPEAVDKSHTLKEYTLGDAQKEKVKTLQRLERNWKPAGHCWRRPGREGTI